MDIKGAVKTALFVSCLILVCTCLAASSKTNFIDENDIQDIANSVCSSDIATINKQIGRISTIDRLVEYARGLTSDSDLFDCFNSGSPNPFEQLQLVVSNENGNVCSEEKINLIEQFHRNYISKAPKDKRLQKEAKLKAPKLLKQFFMHYAYQVSTICKQSLIKRYSKRTDVVLPPIDNAAGLEKVDNLMKDISSKLGASSTSKSYGDIVILWNLIDRLPLNQKENEYISESGSNRVAFKVQDAEAIRRFQKECRRRLRPIYQPIALPVIRMIDLGYFTDGEPFSDQYSQSQDLKRLFGAAQICEFVLQIRAIKDETLKEGDLVLITKEEANQITGDNEESEEEPEGEQITSDMADYQTPEMDDILVTANPDKAGQLVKNLKANIKSREKALSFIMRAIFKQMKNKAKKIVGRIFYTSKSSDSSHVAFEKKVGEPAIDESLVGLTELESHENRAEIEEGSVRKRRSLSKDLNDLKLQFKDSILLGIGLIFVLLIKYFLKLIGMFFNILGDFLCLVFWYPFHWSKIDVCLVPVNDPWLPK